MINKKKLLVLTTTFPRWKGDKEPPFVFELCRRLTDQFEIVVLAPHASGAQIHEVIDGIEIHRFRYCFSRGEQLAYSGGILSNLQLHPWRYALLPSFFLSQLISLYQLLKEKKFDVIHAHWLIPQGLVVAVLRLLLREFPPVLCTSHGGDLLGLNSRLLKKLKSWVLSQTEYTTVVSHAMLEPAYALGARTSHISVIPMGVDTQIKFTPSDISREQYKLLYVGRLTANKGIHYLIDALPILSKQFPNIKLDIVGNGPEKLSLQKYATSRGISTSINFHGAINNSNIPSFCRRSTLLVMPSITTKLTGQEGLGLVLVEALACECPVIASDLPGVRDVVQHRLTGWLVREKDPFAIAEAVSELISNPELRFNLARNGRLHVTQNFDWQRVALRYERLLNDVSQSQLDDCTQA